MIRNLLALFVALTISVTAFAHAGQDNRPKWQKKISASARKTGEKLSAATRKSEEKVGTYSKKESKGTNHAVQRTARRNHLAPKTQEKSESAHTTGRRVARHHRRHVRHHRRHGRHRHHKAHHAAKPASKK